MKSLCALCLLATSVVACGFPTGLKAQAASDLDCEDLSSSKVRNGYSGDDFGARYEVKGCGQKAVYEKKNIGTWSAVTEAESTE